MNTIPTAREVRSERIESEMRAARTALDAKTTDAVDALARTAARMLILIGLDPHECLYSYVPQNGVYLLDGPGLRDMGTLVIFHTEFEAINAAECCDRIVRWMLGLPRRQVREDSEKPVVGQVCNPSGDGEPE